MAHPERNDAPGEPSHAYPAAGGFAKPALTWITTVAPAVVEAWSMVPTGYSAAAHAAPLTNPLPSEATASPWDSDTELASVTTLHGPSSTT